MLIQPATRADITAIRQHLLPLYLPEDDDVVEYFNQSVGNIAMIGDTGEFGHARWSEVNNRSTIVWLLPEGMSVGHLAPLLLALLDALWNEFPQSQGNMSDAVFHHGIDPDGGLEDYGWGKANTWADLIARGGATQPLVEGVYDAAGNRSGTRISMLLAVARSSLREALGGN